MAMAKAHHSVTHNEPVRQPPWQNENGGLDCGRSDIPVFAGRDSQC